MKRDTILQLLIGLWAIVGVLFAVLASLPSTRENLTVDEGVYDGYGEMYRLSQLDIAKEPIAERVNDQSPKRVKKGNNAELIVMGDSFSAVRFGHPAFPDQLADALERKTVVTPERTFTPLAYAKSELTNTDAQRVLVLEITDRFFDDVFLPKPQQLPSVFPKRLASSFLTGVEKQLSFAVQQSIVTQPAYSWLNNTRYELFGVAPLDTPVIQDDMLFYAPAVNHVRTHHTDQAISSAVEILAEQSQVLEQEYNTTLVLAVVPNKFRIYQEGTGHMVKNDTFIDRVQQTAMSEGIPVIDIHAALREARMQDPETLLYWPNDTHWNAAGAAIAVDSMTQVITPLFK
jgi:hypothetical protein